MAAELDSLLSDSTRYAQALRDHGTKVEIVVEPGLVHAAVRARALAPAVEDAWRRYCAAAAGLAGGGRGAR
jgi:acetyl esterase